MMLTITWQQNDQSWSLNVEWIIKNPLFNGFLALFQLEAVEAIDVTFNQIQGPHILAYQLSRGGRLYPPTNVNLLAARPQLRL